MFGYMIISVIIAILSGSGLSLWLGFNVFLALIPIVLITIISSMLDKKEYSFDWKIIGLLIVFILFLPNAFYVITDFIHVNSSDFYNIYAGKTFYEHDLNAYIELMHIAISFLVAMYAFVKSILRFDFLLKKKVESPIRHTIVLLSFISSSVGIYIGRFLRYFSWDIINPFNVIGGLIDEFSSFMIGFIILFTALQYIVYYGYRLLYEKEPF